MHRAHAFILLSVVIVAPPPQKKKRCGAWHSAPVILGAPHLLLFPAHSCSCTSSVYPSRHSVAVSCLSRWRLYLAPPDIIIPQQCRHDAISCMLVYTLLGQHSTPSEAPYFVTAMFRCPHGSYFLLHMGESDVILSTILFLHTDISVRACTSCRPFVITSKSFGYCC